MTAAIKLNDCADDTVESILNEPCPCDTCRHAARCAVTEEACEAFKQYVLGRQWNIAPRQPRRDIGQRLLKSD